MTPEQLDIIVGWASLALTLMVFSYLLGDNFLYRVAVHVLVGAAAGYVAIAAVVDVILPWLDATTLTSDSTVSTPARALGLLPIVIALMLLLKSSPRLAHIGNYGVLIMVAIGTGVALVGAVIGTVIPLVRDSGNSVDNEEAFNGILMVVGTISTLVYFQYISRQRPTEEAPKAILPIRILSFVGQSFIAVTLGALYAATILTSLTIFDQLIADHIRFLLDRMGG